jgi:hypothetical protein
MCNIFAEFPLCELELDALPFVLHSNFFECLAVCLRHRTDFASSEHPYQM